MGASISGQPHSNTIPPDGRMAGFAVFGAVLIGLFILGQTWFLLFHTLAELFSITVACCIFVVAWNARRFQHNGFLLLIGISSLGVAAIDMFHTMAFKGVGILPDWGAPVATQLWIAGRYLQAGTFLLAPLFIRRRLNPTLVVGCIMALTLLLMASILVWPVFPVCFVDDVGVTPFKTASEIVVCLMYAGAIAALVRRREAFAPRVLRYLVGSLIVLILTELTLTSYVDVFGLTLQIGHLLKIIGFYLIYKGVVETGVVNPYDLLFRELKLKEEALVAERNELRQAHARIASILESISEAFFTLDRQWRFSYLNGQAARLLNRRVEELIGRNVWEEYPEAIGSVFDREYHRVAAEGVPSKFEEYYHPLERWFEVHAYPAPEGVAVYFSDVTERKRMNEEIELLNTDLAARAVELELLNSELEAFNYSVSHDLRAPLTNICGQCQVILELFSEKADPQVLEFVRGILSESWRMNSLITTLLNFSRLSRAEISREPVDLTAMVREIAGELLAREPDRAVRFDIEEGVCVVGDRALLRVVLENLLGNAWKYSGKNAEARVSFGTTVAGGRAACFVKDNGVGFDMAHAGELFAPFKRLHGRHEFEGFGIGLATVQRIIARHGGRVWAEATPGEGATFYFAI